MDISQSGALIICQDGEERGGVIVITLMLLQCSAATQQQTAALQQVLPSTQSGHNFLLLIPSDCSRTQTAITAYILRCFN